MDAKPGDKVLVETITEKIEGVLMPSPELEKNTIIVKLDSGYNIGISKKEVKKVSLLQKLRQAKITEKKILEKKALPKITILHTGGTIASKADYRTGAVVSRFSPSEIISMFPELNETASIGSRLISNMFSEDMRFAHYNRIAEEIKKEAEKGAEGVIVTHGTDTMHYTSAALAFMLGSLSIPVMLVGAQRSSDRGSSDAGLNLLSAAHFIANTDFAGVAVCMHETISDNDCLILPALKTRKMHTSRRDAFKPINTTAIARVNYEEKRVSFMKRHYTKKSRGKITIRPMNENLKIGFLVAHPNMSAKEISAFEGFDGLVVEGTGLGHLPTNQIDDATAEHKKILEEIRKLCKKTVVVMSPQTIHGRLQMNVYSSGRDLQAAGVLGNYSDMTPETTFIKLAWLLSNYPKQEVEKLITKNLKGEVSRKTRP